MKIALYYPALKNEGSIQDGSHGTTLFSAGYAKPNVFAKHRLHNWEFHFHFAKCQHMIIFETNSGGCFEGYAQVFVIWNFSSFRIQA